MATLISDRRLYLTADRSEVVEEGDVRGAWLLAGVGGQLGEGDVQKYGLSMSGGRVRYEGAPDLPALGDEAAAEHAEAEAAHASEPARPADVKRFGGDDADGLDAEEEEAGDEQPVQDLPDDLPGRERLLAAGLSTVDAVRDYEDLTDVDGIGAATADRIRAYLSDEE